MLTREDALDRLRGMVAAQTDPALTSSELDSLLTHAAVVDAVGRQPDDESWEPTYSPVMLNASAAEGWRWKAGKLTADKTLSDAQGNSWSPEQRRRDMLEIAMDYQRRVRGSRQTPSRGSASDRVSGVILN